MAKRKHAVDKPREAEEPEQASRELPTVFRAAKREE